jgi:hypothetical protein
MVRDQPHGLAVFDLDGTLLRGLTVCEVLAGPLGHLERMQQFEALLHTSALDIAAATLPPPLQGVAHFPNAGMRRIAHWLIARWRQSVSPVL